MAAEPTARRVGARWLGAVVVAALAALAAFAALGVVMPELAVLGGYVAGGVCLVAGQSWVVGRYVSRRGGRKWATATALGAVLAVLLLPYGGMLSMRAEDLLFAGDESALGSVLMGASGGLGLGLGQAVTLRRRLRAALPWVLASTAGGALGVLAGVVAGEVEMLLVLLPRSGLEWLSRVQPSLIVPAAFLLPVLAGALVYGGLTGAVMARLTAPRPTAGTERAS